MNVQFDETVEVGDYVAVGEDGICTVARFGDMVIGRVFKSIQDRGELAFIDINSFKMEGYWVFLTDGKVQFYKDKYTPTNKFKQHHRMDLDYAITVKDFAKLLEPYMDEKYKIEFDEDGIFVSWTDEWEE